MQQATGTTAKSWCWALLPGLTLGFGTAAVMVHAAVRKRSLLQGASVPLYIVALALMLTADPDHGETQEVVFNLALAVSMGLGLVHAIGIRGWVFESAAPARLTLRARQRAALRASEEAQEARRAARALVERDPRLARRLHVGRPDISGRAYPDGGLVDVNQVSADTLAQATRMPSHVAGTITSVRDRTGGFSSYEDMLVLTDVPPAVTDPVSDLLVFTRT